MENSKRTIAIVCGGDSSEHDVSLRSGQGLYSFFFSLQWCQLLSGDYTPAAAGTVTSATQV